MTSAPDQTLASPQPLLATKLFAPAPNAELVSRPRLVERFQQGIARRLTVVSAPAGSGKTTLVAEWHASEAGSTVPLAWISLDEGDNDPVRFLSYFAAAIQTVHPEIGDRIVAMLNSGQPTSTEYLMSLLLNEISGLQQRFVLSLDDYHVIENESIHAGLTFLIDHLPPQFHLVITSRTEPPFPLSRLRVRGQLSEFHAEDLRFASQEVSQFFNRIMQLDLDENAVSILVEQTEGWAAGLLLAGLSLQQQDDVDEFISSFAGSNRYILDYLAEEVLSRQPPNLQEFLLQTSILPRMNADLCNVVTERADGQRSLDTIDEANLFLIPLDNVQRWFRYHHLFSGFLTERLLQQQPNLVPELHRRASRWFAEEGSVREAIDHALMGGDYDHAAELIARFGTPMIVSGELFTVLDWIDALPPEIVEASPDLNAAQAWGLILNGKVEEALPILDRVEFLLEAEEVDTESWSNFTGQVALARSTIARYQNDIPNTLHYGELAAEHLQGSNPSAYGASQAHLAFANLMTGKLVEARQILENARPEVDRFGSLLERADLRTLLALVCVSEGKLSEAAAICHEMLSDEEPIAGQLGVGRASTVLAGVLRERNDLEEAEQLVLESVEIADRVGMIHSYTQACIELARIRLDQGDLEAAGLIIDDVERAANRARVTNYVIHNLNELRIRVAIAANDRGIAHRYALPQPIEVPADTDFTCGSELIANTQLLIVEEQFDAVLALLGKLERCLIANGVRGLLPEVLTLQAIALDRTGQSDKALVSMARSLETSEPEGYVRAYLNNGEPVSDLLKRLIRTTNWDQHATPRNISIKYVLHLLSEFGIGEEGEQPAILDHQLLVEPLTDREFEVLRAMAKGKTNRIIAGELFVAIGTVKTHSHNIYQKLGVRNRTQAIIRARELTLVD